MQVGVRAVSDNNNCDLDTVRVGFFRIFSFRLEASVNALSIPNKPQKDSGWGKNTGSHLHSTNIEMREKLKEKTNMSRAGFFTGHQHTSTASWY